MENLTIQNVPAANMIGMAVSLIVAVGLPIALCILVRRKTKARISSFFIGAATFILFALILEQILHMVVFSAAGTVLNGNIWLYALYGGLAAGLFEETGRYLAMKLCMKKTLNKQNAIMYGVGHGGIEAILLIGLSCISNLLLSVLINSGQLSVLLPMTGLEDAAYQQVVTQLSALSTTPAWQFYLAGVERISAVIFHISASYLVYLAVKNKKISFYFLAVLAHFLLDAVTVAAARYLPILAVEVILLAVTGIFGCVILRMYHKEPAAAET